MNSKDNLQKCTIFWGGRRKLIEFVGNKSIFIFKNFILDWNFINYGTSLKNLVNNFRIKLFLKIRGNIK
jgi:hypothetical protein